jgi:hypothetical protein
MPHHGSPVLDEEGLGKAYGEPLTHQARENVGRAAGRERNDHAHWPRGIRLRPCDARHGRQSGSARRRKGVGGRLWPFSDSRAEKMMQRSKVS